MYRDIILQIKKRKFIIITIFLIPVIILSLLFYSNRKNENSIVKLNVSVQYDEKKLIITNRDTIDIIHADLAINEYYKIRNVNLKKGESYTIWQVEFLHHNGRRFPNKQKPVNFSIWCELNNGRNGYYFKKIRQ